MRGDALNHLRVGELDVDGSRQRIHAIELVNDFAGAHGVAEVLQGFVFRGEIDALHTVHLLDGLHDRIDVGLFGIVGHICRDGNLVFHRLHRVVDDKAANKENADDEQGQENRDNRTERRGKFRVKPVSDSLKK